MPTSSVAPQAGPRLQRKPGVVGEVEGIACVYGIVDDFNTVWARGCFDRTKKENVARGLTKLFVDHGMSPCYKMYQTKLHVGTVRSLDDVQLPNGLWAAKMRADIFDTAAGRELYEYLQALMAAGGETGLSVAAEPIKKQPGAVDGQRATRFLDVNLPEISVTAMPGVPGSRVTAVRAAPVVRLATMEERMMAFRRSYAPVQRYATMQERLEALRHLNANAQRAA